MTEKYCPSLQILIQNKFTVALPGLARHACPFLYFIPDIRHFGKKFGGTYPVVIFTKTPLQMNLMLTKYPFSYNYFLLLRLFSRHIISYLKSGSGYPSRIQVKALEAIKGGF